MYGDVTSQVNSQPRDQIYNSLLSHDPTQLNVLQGMIRKLDEHRKMRAIKDGLDELDVDEGEYLDEG